jgi:hypothetical protein
MLALVLLLTFVVLLLGILVAGLLRSHADILKALHELGAGVGDPVADASPGHNHHHQGDPAPRPVAVPFTMGPLLPAERNHSWAPTLAGVTPRGDALAIAVAGSETLTLIAFLSSGCSTCAGLWAALRRPDDLGLPDGIRLVVVTKGPDMEIPAEVQARTSPGLQVIMSTEAWNDYEVPGSPFFALVDGRTGHRIGEGVAQVDLQPFSLGSRGRASAAGLDGPERESANDRELLAAGIHPGHSSLYPKSLGDVFPPGHSPMVDADRAGKAG